MGYTTEFQGRVKVNPPLNDAEVAYVNKFSNTRRMDRRKGPYFVDGTGYYGQNIDADVINVNNPPAGQPGLWCQWVATEDGAYIEWNGAEKFYHSAQWMQYLIDHFFKPGCAAAGEFSFLQANHILDGEITAEGEDSEDRWKLVVKNNVVNTKQGVITYS